MAILDYISADILKVLYAHTHFIRFSCVDHSYTSVQLAGNFVKNTRKPAIYINTTDIRVSMAADPVCVHVCVHGVCMCVSACVSVHMCVHVCVCVCVCVCVHV